jgi:hypothetical protein
MKEWKIILDKLNEANLLVDNDLIKNMLKTTDAGYILRYFGDNNIPFNFRAYIEKQASNSEEKEAIFYGFNTSSTDDISEFIDLNISYEKTAAFQTEMNDDTFKELVGEAKAGKREEEVIKTYFNHDYQKQYLLWQTEERLENSLDNFIFSFLKHFIKTKDFFINQKTCRYLKYVNEHQKVIIDGTVGSWKGNNLSLRVVVEDKVDATKRNALYQVIAELLALAYGNKSHRDDDDYFGIIIRGLTFKFIKLRISVDILNNVRNFTPPQTTTTVTIFPNENSLNLEVPADRKSILKVIEYITTVIK